MIDQRGLSATAGHSMLELMQNNQFPLNPRPLRPAIWKQASAANRLLSGSASTCRTDDIERVAAALPVDLRAPYWSAALLGLRRSTLDPHRILRDRQSDLVAVLEVPHMRIIPVAPAAEPWLDVAFRDGHLGLRFTRTTGATVTGRALAHGIDVAGRTVGAADGSAAVSLPRLRSTVVRAVRDRGVAPDIVATYFGIGEFDPSICADCLSEVADAIQDWYEESFDAAAAKVTTWPDERWDGTGTDNRFPGSLRVLGDPGRAE